MRILLIGANGEIGKILNPALAKNHEIISAGRNSGDFKIDLSNSKSIEKLFEEVKNIDSCICVAGDCYTGDLHSLDEEKLNIGIKNKLLGQVNLVLIGQKYLNDNGSFILTSGKMGDKPVKNNISKAIVNAGINSFVLSASLELERGIRINAISPAKVSDIPAEDLINAYTKSIEESVNGKIIKVNY
ncbi:short chain dehydrogenase [Flavobacterium sp. WLB]|uniref:short chain dehydrogenase n=1 Tax=unclassified Flavobacterium TaxID=196869 RepID=UPI0006AB966D|nr:MULTISPECIES: short chain dehydrogenase [unclassified Flavobacterium]KOP36870.1 short-chain dehydrogenase [Flavobacterium sp. VMW]OWU89047.1 short-chain dehydrogenase [Flavobacterium sp. NLM]PUU69943.1 short chain dehydrogenase [Flavobacterium sp. WLB]